MGNKRVQADIVETTDIQKNACNKVIRLEKYDNTTTGADPRAVVEQMLFKIRPSFAFTLAIFAAILAAICCEIAFEIAAKIASVNGPKTFSIETSVWARFQIDHTRPVIYKPITI